MTLLLVALNVLAYRLELAAGGMPVCEAHGLVPARFVASGDWTHIASAMFLHDPRTLLHLGGNMACLALFGAIVERELGGLLLLALYAAAGVAGALLHVTVDPSSTLPLVGASGAVFGIMAVAGVLRPRLLGFALALGGVEVWHAVVGGSGNVSFGCHLGGLAAGAALAALLRVTGSEALEAA